MIEQTQLEKYSNEWKDTLYTLYWIEELTLKQIADKTGINVSNIHSQFKKLEIPTRTFGGNKRIDWNKEDLHRLYWEKKLSTNQIGEIYQTRGSVVRKQMSKLGISTREKNIPQFDRDELHYLYWGEKLSTEKIGEKYEVDGRTVRNYLKRFGIPTRSEYFLTQKDEFHRLYWEEGLNTYQIAEKYDVSHVTINKLFEKLNIPLRTFSENKLNIKEQRMKEITVDEELISLIDGILLGDGCITKDFRSDNSNGYLTIAQRIDRVEWLQDIKDRLHHKGVKSVIRNHTQNGFQRFANDVYLCKPQKVIATEYLPLFKEQRERWYPNGKKVIPEDVRLTPLSLAMWYFGDGSLTRYNIVLHTNGFTTADVQYLSNKLIQYYQINNKVKDKRGPVICVSTNNTTEFLDLIKPYYLPCFDYKYLNGGGK